jgi:hypothetical protein
MPFTSLSETCFFNNSNVKAQYIGLGGQSFNNIKIKWKNGTLMHDNALLRKEINNQFCRLREKAGCHCIKKGMW